VLAGGHSVIRYVVSLLPTHQALCYKSDQDRTEWHTQSQSDLSRKAAVLNVTPKCTHQCMLQSEDGSAWETAPRFDRDEGGLPVIGAGDSSSTTFPCTRVMPFIRHSFLKLLRSEHTPGMHTYASDVTCTACVTRLRRSGAVAHRIAGGASRASPVLADDARTARLAVCPRWRWRCF